MKHALAILAVACALAVSGHRSLRAEDDADRALRNKLIGTWQMKSAKFGGQASELPRTQTTLKLVTPQGFVWLSYDPETRRITRSAGGTYTLKGGTYTENIEYGLGDDYEVIKNSHPAFTCRIEGDRWFHAGKLANGTAIEEVWGRVGSAGASR